MQWPSHPVSGKGSFPCVVPQMEPLSRNVEKIVLVRWLLLWLTCTTVKLTKMEVEPVMVVDGIEVMRHISDDLEQFEDEEYVPTDEELLKDSDDLEQFVDEEYVPTDEELMKDQPVSAYCLFMDQFMKGRENENYIEADREGFEKWQSMSKQERMPFMYHACAVDSEYRDGMLIEANRIVKVNDEADSAKPVKVEKSQWIYIESSDEE